MKVILGDVRNTCTVGVRMFESDAKYLRAFTDNVKTVSFFGR